MTSLHDLESRLKPSPRLPVMFVGHGNPMNAILDNSFSRTWSTLGAELPAAQAIVVISAHWLTPGSTRVLDAPKNPVIYDFGGFPDELYRVQYTSFGDRGVAELLARQLVEYEARLDAQWGLDHGTWSVLVHLAPKPEVPVLQISIDYSLPLPQLHELFGRLRALRDRGVIFIGSGNIVHNLRRLRNAPWEWAVEFDELSAQAILERDTSRLLDPINAWGTAASMAIPTDDHYRPFVAALSLLDPDEDIRWFNTEIDAGSIGMRSFVSA